MNDRDGLTDMTLLHYTCKSGAHGIGEYVASLLKAWDIYVCACICQPESLQGDLGDDDNIPWIDEDSVRSTPHLVPVPPFSWGSLYSLLVPPNFSGTGFMPACLLGESN